MMSGVAACGEIQIVAQIFGERKQGPPRNGAPHAVLQLLTRFFTHTDETDEQLRTLVDGAINVMSGVVRPLGRALATMPVGLEHPGQTAGFAFDMYYPMGNFVPWRESAWAVLRERTTILTDRCSEVETAGKASEIVTQVRQRVEAIAATLTVEVPVVTAGS